MPPGYLHMHIKCSAFKCFKSCFFSFLFFCTKGSTRTSIIYS